MIDHAREQQTDILRTPGSYADDLALAANSMLVEWKEPNT